MKSVVGTAVSAGAGLASAAGANAGQLANAAPDVAESLGIRQQDILAPVNDRLRSEGKPTISPREMDATIKDVARTSVRGGRVDRDVIVTSVTRNTRLSGSDAQDVANRIETQVNQQGSQMGQDLQSGAAKAADTTGHAMWWVFLGMVLGLGAAVVGSTPPEAYVTHHPAHST